MAAPGSTIFLLDGNLINLSSKCVNALSQPMSFISRSHRTDIARMVFQVWIWALTIWALLLESVPHLTAVGASQVLNTAFVALDLKESIDLSGDFTKIVNKDCDGVNVLPDFWPVLIKLDLVATIFSGVTVLAVTFLGLKLYSVLDWRTFKKLGASRMVRIAHTFSLIFGAVVQLNTYFVVVFLALWLDELITHRWKADSTDIQRHVGFKIAVGVLLALSIPWLIIGNSSLKRENIIGIVVFLSFDVVLLAFTIFLLGQRFYKKMARSWIFLRFVGFIACILMVASLLIAIGCLLVFDRGLLTKVNRDSKRPPDLSERLSLNDEEIAFPNNDVKPYSYEKNQTNSAFDPRHGMNSIIKEPQAAHPSRMEYLDHSEHVSSLEYHPDDGYSHPKPGVALKSHYVDRQSWIEGDEASWMAPGADRSRMPNRNPSTSTYSSDAFSYATTTFSRSGSEREKGVRRPRS